MALTPGTRLGHYEILSALGAGGMGVVYRAHDTRLRREVAVKVLQSPVSAEPEWLARFEREARSAAALNHPNIVTLHGIEEHDGTRYLIMELVEGESLDRLVAPGGLPLARVLPIAIAVAEAMMAAHERRIVHRDLKPANVMLTADGRVKVLDFGLAKRMDPDSPEALETMTSPISTAGEVVGTTAYMSPEQLRGKAVDARSDLFAFGVMLHELLTGQRPFRGATSAEVAAAILHERPIPVERLRADVPDDLARLVARCLEKDPGLRTASARDARNELVRVRSSVESRQAGGNAAAVRGERSIAVLPFQNRGNAEQDEYFADGITEDVIAQLCKMHLLKVISRGSVMAFKRHEGDLREVADKLQVTNVLEGSVRRLGDRVRIVAQLVDPRTGASLWAETYDRQLTDIFEIQTEVALQIANALKTELTPTERARIRREPTRDVLAYELYLRGRQCLFRFTVEEMRRSIEYFDRALERDPDLAPAHVARACAYTELVESGVLERGEAGPIAKAAAARAVTLDPDSGEANWALAYTQMVFDMDWVAAEKNFRRALELSPSDGIALALFGRMLAGLERYDEAIALQTRAHELDPLANRCDLANVLVRSGRHDEAIPLLRRSLELEPHDARLHATLGWALFRQGHTADGITELEFAVRLAPDENIWLAQLGEAYGLAGETAKAREVLRRLEDVSRPATTSPYHLAYVYTGLGELDRAIDFIELALERGTGAVHSIKGSFLLTPLRHHPRFEALLKRIGVA